MLKKLLKVLCGLLAHNKKHPAKPKAVNVTSTQLAIGCPDKLWHLVAHRATKTPILGWQAQHALPPVATDKSSDSPRLLRRPRLFCLSTR